MILCHGTGTDVGPAIEREGLRGKGRPVFLAEGAEVAQRYARARAARAFVGGGAPVGLVVSVEVDAEDVEPDPWAPDVEPGQWVTWADVPASAVVGVAEVRFPWRRVPGGGPWPSVGLIAGLAEAVTLERVHLDGQDRWAPLDAQGLGRDLRALDEVARGARRREP